MPVTTDRGPGAIAIRPFPTPEVPDAQLEAPRPQIFAAEARAGLRPLRK